MELLHPELLSSMCSLLTSRRTISRDFSSQLLKGPSQFSTSGHTLLRIVHIQWLIQAGVKRLPILAQCETALMANMCFSIPRWVGHGFVRPELQFDLQWSAKKLTCQKTAIWPLLSPTPLTSFTSIDSKISASEEANLCQRLALFMPPKHLCSVSWTRSLSNLIVSSLWARNI